MYQVMCIIIPVQVLNKHWYSILHLNKPIYALSHTVRFLSVNVQHCRNSFTEAGSEHYGMRLLCVFAGFTFFVAGGKILGKMQATLSTVYIVSFLKSLAVVHGAYNVTGLSVTCLAIGIICIFT